MPAAIPFIAGQLATAAGATAFQAAVVTLAASVAVADYQRNRAQSRAQAAADQAARGRTFAIRSGVAPSKLVLGTARLSGPFMHADFVGDSKEWLDQVIALTRSPVEFLSISLDDEVIPLAAFAGGEFPTTGRYASSTAPFERATQAEIVSGITSYTLPRTPEPGTPVVAILADGTGSDASSQPTPISSVVGAVVNFPAPISGYLSIQYSTQAVDAAKLRVLFNTGTPTQAALLFGDVSSPLWTSAHRLRGVSSLRVLMRVEDPAYRTGVPNISATVRGPLGVVWDPRTSAYASHTSNPALLAAWFRTLPEIDGGMGVPTEWIDWPSVAAAANVCDELISVKKLDNTGFENIKRYECNTVLSLDRAPGENLQTILNAMAGDFPFTAGKYRCFAGAFRSAAITITDAMVASADSIVLAPTTDTAGTPPNIVTAQYYDATKNHAQTAAPAVENSAYITADGEQSAIDYELDAVTDPRQANYLQGVLLERGRPALLLNLGVAGVGANVALMDTLQFNMQGYEAIASKTFEVRRRTNHWNGRYSLELREVRPSTYALDAERFTPVAPPAVADNTHLWSVAAPTSLAATTAAPQRQSDGTVLNTATVTWAAHPAASVKQGGAILLRWRRAAGAWVYLPAASGSATTQDIAGLPAGQAVFIEAAARNSLGAQSAWVGLAYQVGPLELRGNLLDGGQWVPGTTGTQGVAPARFLQSGNAGENTIVLAPGPDGQTIAQWQCTSVDGPTPPGGEPDGGWDTEPFPIDHRKQYLFAQFVQCLGVMDGSAYLGLGANTVRAIGGAVLSNPYFVVVDRSTLTLGKHYLLVGYVFPSTYAGAQLSMGGIWDGITGEKLGGAPDFQWVDGQTTTTQRSYLYYASTGAIQRMAPPLVVLCDGTEPSVPQILAAAALGRATAAVAAAGAAQSTANTANSRIAAMETDGLLTPIEKPQLVQDYSVITTEQSGLDAQAAAYGITTERTAYNNAIAALTAHLATLTTPTAWNDLAGDTTITGTTLRGKFADVYATKQALQNTIAAQAGTRAAWANVSGVNVTTGQIAAGAATEVYVNTPGSAVTVTGVMSTPDGFASLKNTLLASVTFTPSASGTATALFDGYGQITSSGASEVRWSIQDEGATWDGWKLVYFQPSSSAAHKFSMSTTRRFAVTAGVPYTISVFGAKFVTGDTFTVKNHELRIEVIKR